MLDRFLHREDRELEGEWADLIEDMPDIEVRVRVDGEEEWISSDELYAAMKTAWRNYEIG